MHQCPSYGRDQYQCDNTHGEDHRQQVDKLHRTRMALLEIDTGDAAIIDLTEEFLEVRTPFVPHPGLWEELWLIACLDNAIGEVDVLAKAHL